MIDNIRIRGFRALKNVEIALPLGRPLVVIGENATGKSTLVDAVAFLRAVARGQAEQAFRDRDGWAAVAWAGTSAEIEIVVRFSERSSIFQKEGSPVEYAIRFGSVRSIPTILDEEVRVYKKGFDQKPFVALKGGKLSWAANVQNKQREPVQPAGLDRSIVTESTLATVMDEARYPTPVHVKIALESIAFYPSFALGFAAGSAAGAESLGARPVELTRRITSSGRDLLNALHTLSQEQPDAWNALLTDLRAVFPWCQSIRFPPGPGRGVIMLTWLDARSGATLYLDDMSEGMRVYLALLAALHARDTPALIAFDEPERSLHPRAIQRFVKVLESRAEGTPILVATHADRLLDHLEDPAESLRVTRFSTEAGVTIEALDADLLNTWRHEYSLSEMRFRGMLEAPARDDEIAS